MNESYSICPMTPDHYSEVYHLWKTTPGIGLSEADSEDQTARYLERNPGLSFVAISEGQIVGAILCGHDGRRGFIHHACVSPEYRFRGIGKALVQKSLEKLKAQGIGKCHLFVLCTNELGQAFWENLGWQKRTDICLFSKTI